MSTIQDLRKIWLAAGSLLTAFSGDEVAETPCLLALAVESLPLCLQVERDRYAALLWYLLNPLFSEQARLRVRQLG